MIALTIDTDWACKEIVEDTLDLIQSYGCKKTLFFTNELKLKKDPDEIAIHPNFENSDNFEDPIKDLKSVFPNSLGTRSHCLHYNERIIDIYHKYGIQYSSNQTHYYYPTEICSMISNDVCSIPIFFMDRYYMEYGINGIKNFSIDELNLSSPGIRVFDFHPIHIFLNTNSLKRYNELKSRYHDFDYLSKNIMEGPGTRTMLIQLLEHISDNGIETYTMSEINQEFNESSSTRR